MVRSVDKGFGRIDKARTQHGTSCVLLQQCPDLRSFDLLCLTLGHGHILLQLRFALTDAELDVVALAHKGCPVRRQNCSSSGRLVVLTSHAREGGGVALAVANRHKLGLLFQGAEHRGIVVSHTGQEREEEDSELHGAVYDGR